MGVKLKGQVTAADVAKLRDIHRQLQSLGVGLHPAAPASVSLTAALWTVRTVIRHWSGEDVDMPPGPASDGDTPAAGA
jgi:hypothetical protein